MKGIFAFAAIGVSLAAVTHSSAAIVVTEVHSNGSGNSTYAADWFELTNTGASAVDITGWKVDDSSGAFGSAVAFRGLTSIPAGASVVFFEGNTSGSNDATIRAAFIDAWFGGTAPAGFLIGSYGGSGIGLSTSGDAVNIYNAGGTLIHGVSFGTFSPGLTFDNNMGASGAITTFSAVGVNGAFNSVTGGEVGSPGLVPAPSAAALLGLGGLLAARRRR